MKIKNHFYVPLPVAEAWAVLNDIPRVARCAPGAELVEQRPDGSYVGVVRVKLGPVALSFRGSLVYKERDEAKHRVLAEVSGNEERARGTARAVVAFALAPDPAGTRIDVDTDLQLAGSIAQYGRGATLIQSTAQVLMGDFARNFAAEFGSGAVAAPAAEGSAAPVSPPSTPQVRRVSALGIVVRSLLTLLKSWLGQGAAAERRQ